MPLLCTPLFWQKSRVSLWARLCFGGLSYIYQKIIEKRLQQKPIYQAPIPVICVGNITMGGAGKTPVVHALAHMLKDMGYTPAILLRGYGGIIKEPCLVDINKHTAYMIGDEALLHAQHTSTWVSPNRAKGAQAIVKHGQANVILLDDGLQNPQLHYDVRLMVVDKQQGLGNGCVFPLGPLRETLVHVLQRIDAIIAVGQSPLSLQLPAYIPLWHANIQTTAQPQAARYLAFAGIAYPQKFYATLAQSGFNVVATQNFADHQPYTIGHLNTLQKQASQINAQLITTQKDWVRLPPSWQTKINYLPIQLHWANPEIIIQFLKVRLT